MNTQEARHAMVDGKRVSLPAWMAGSYAHFENGQFLHYVIGEPTPDEDDDVPLFSSKWMESRDDWYVVGEEKESKFRECAIHNTQGVGLSYHPPTCPTGWRSLRHVLADADFAGILMPDEHWVFGLFTHPHGGPCIEASMHELNAGTLVPVDLTKCKVLLRRS